MKKRICVFMVVCILSITLFGCVENKEESIETNSNSIEHKSDDFGSNGWHKYRIRNKD